MTKSEARRFYSQKREQLDIREVNVFQDLMLIQFQQLDLPYLNLVHSYIKHPLRQEPNPENLLDWLLFRDPGVSITYASSNPNDYTMVHYLHAPEMTFKLNQFGIPEPEVGELVDPLSIDMAIIPLLACDLKGNRVGYGKGYYDRFLSKCRTDILKIGLSFFSPIDEVLDVGIFDKKLDFCITPSQVYAF